MPLTFWALHRAVNERSRAFGVLSGLFIWLQILSSVYYGIFLAIAVAAFTPCILLPPYWPSLEASRACAPRST